ncbi:MAG: dihydrolipoyl dehydrogenase [Pseudomonadota bacterium]
MAKEIKVPDIGDFEGVEIIDVLVEAGQDISTDDSLITLESDKASMDIPAPTGGKITEIKVKAGDRVSEGDVILLLEAAEEQGKDKAEPPKDKPQEKAEQPASRPVSEPGDKGDVHAEVVVLGAGPGGYTAAFRAADLGLKTILIDSRETLGGVCLNVGCIPSKALLHAANVIAEAREMSEHGIGFDKPKINLDDLRGWKDGVVNKLVGGLGGMAKQRKVEWIRGVGKFTGPNMIEVALSDGGTRKVSFNQAIIAAGSEPVTLPFIPHNDPRVLDSTGALELEDIPKRFLLVGGGIIGLEMATVYCELGAEVSVVELTDQLMPGADKDLVQPLTKRIQKLYKNIYLNTKVTNVEAMKSGLKVTFEGKDAPKTQTFDRILVAVGRKPNGKLIAADRAGVEVDDHGFIHVDKQQRTNVGHIFAIGDIVGQPMLAHKATHEGKVAAEVCAGHKSAFDAKVIPSVAYTDPEVAWCGITEHEAKDQGVKYEKGVFPWAASGRALAINRTEGMTKLLFDPESERVIGAGMVGPNAGDLIAEVAHAIEMDADATDIGSTIHPHPTLSESVGMAAEVFEGTITDLYLPKKKK